MTTVNVQADNSTLTLNGRTIKSFSDGDIISITYVNSKVEHLNSSEGGVNINDRSDGGVVDLVMRVQKMSPDDVFMNAARESKPSIVFNGSLKSRGTVDGNDFVETYDLTTGSITKQPVGRVNNLEGSNESEYMIRFRNCVRSM